MSSSSPDLRSDTGWIRAVHGARCGYENYSEIALALLVKELYAYKCVGDAEPEESAHGNRKCRCGAQSDDGGQSMVGKPQLDLSGTWRAEAKAISGAFLRPRPQPEHQTKHHFDGAEEGWQNRHANATDQPGAEYQGTSVRGRSYLLRFARQSCLRQLEPGRSYSQLRG